MSGKIHLYSGDGKGKTTAALGLATRAAGAGMQVLFVQFLKDGNSSEMAVLQRIPNIKTLYVTKPFGFTWTLTEEEKRELTEENNKLLEEALTFARAGKGMLILDEIVATYGLELVSKDLVKILLEDHGDCEIVMTGRNPKPELLEAADYHTEMVCRKHPYEDGLDARKGIEY